MSYQFMGHKWGVPDFGRASGEVTWSADLDGLVFDAGAWSLDDFDAEIEAAFATWESVAALTFIEIPEGGDIVFEVIDIDSVAPDLFDAVGLARITYTELPGLDEIVRARVGFEIDEFWGPGDGDGGLSFAAVALHEIGHTMGLDHVRDPDQIMNYYVTPARLGEGDIIAAQLLYGTDEGDPEIALPPPPSESALDAGGESGDGGGGGGGGLVVALLGLIAALVGGLFGAGGGFGRVAAQRGGEEATDIHGIAALDWMPTVAVADEDRVPDDDEDGDAADAGLF